MTEEQQMERKAKIGKAWAEILGLKKSKTNKDRYYTSWGDKTDFGIYLVICRLVGDARSREVDTDETV